jgi:hypothetical protein
MFFTMICKEIIYRPVKSRLPRSDTSQVHDWVVNRLDVLLGSVGHRVKIHKITPVTGKERDDLEIKDYVVLQKPQEQDQFTHTRCSDGAPEPDGVLKTVTRSKIIHYRQLYLNRPDPITFIPVPVDTLGCIYDDFSRLLFLHTHREASTLTNELPEESDQFRFLRADSLTNLKGSLGLIKF